MDARTQSLLNKISCASITLATFTLLIFFFQTPETCVQDSPLHPPSKPHKSLNQNRFPRSTCDVSHREFLPIEKKNKRLWSTKAWSNTVSSYTDFFRSLQRLNLIHNHSNVLCISAGAGHAVMALNHIGVEDTTGVEVVDSPPLVKKADPHNLPFFDNVFDLAFTANFPEALFPERFVGEMERTVKDGGVCVLAVADCSDEDVKDIVSLFRLGNLVSVTDATLAGIRMKRVIIKIGN